MHLPSFGSSKNLMRVSCNKIDLRKEFQFYFSVFQFSGFLSMGVDILDVVFSCLQVEESNFWVLFFMPPS